MEDMAAVPQDEWNKVRDAVIGGNPSSSLYRDPGETFKGDLKTFIGNVDAMAHQELVERLAVTYGDDDAIRRVWNVAEGDGADTSDWAKEHAKSVLARVDADTLGAWVEKNGKKN